MKCSECLYHYHDTDNEGNSIGNAYCHYSHDDGQAPCEVDDDYETEDCDEE